MVARDSIVELVVRPTGLIDPKITLKPLKGQIDDLIEEVRKRVERKERVLVTTLTKRTAEELTDYLRDIGINVRYLHSEIDAIERVEILRALRKGEFDVLVGINLLREGLDLPEVSLVAILDADKEGYLRSATSLIQTAGRAARHLERRSHSLRRRDDAEHPEISRRLRVSPRKTDRLQPGTQHHAAQRQPRGGGEPCEPARRRQGRRGDQRSGGNFDVTETMRELEEEMLEAANNLEFEKAALLRDQIRELKRTYGSETGQQPAKSELLVTGEGSGGECGRNTIP